MVGAVRCKGRVSEDPRESGFGISGFSKMKKPSPHEPGYRETRFLNRVKVRSGGQVSGGQPSKGSTPGGIGDRRIKDFESVSPTPFNFTKSETPIGEGLWSCGPAGHMRRSQPEGAEECKKVSWRIGNRGSVR
jgi:hypothetical protein